MHASWYDHHDLPEFDVEPIREPPGTIVYTRDPDEELARDAHELAAIRARRKQRIQATARIYLNGGRLSLTSTTLGGPFGTGWVNPWSTNKKRKYHHSTFDGPESAVEIARKLLRNDELKEDHTIRPSTPVAARQYIADPFLSTRNEPHTQPTPEEKVKLWLRRNNEAVREQPEETRTPSKRRRTNVESTRPIPLLARTPSRQFIAISSQDVHAPGPALDSRFAASQATVVPGGLESSQRVNTHSALQNAIETDDIEDEAIGLEDEDIPDPVRPMYASERAQDAIRMIRQQSSATPRTLNRSRDFSSNQRRSIASHTRSPEVTRYASVSFSNADQIHVQLEMDDPAASDTTREDTDTGIGNELGADTTMVGNAPDQIEPVASTIQPPSAQPRTQLATSTSNISSIPMLSTLAGPIASESVNVLQPSTDEPSTNNENGKVNQQVSFSSPKDQIDYQCAEASIMVSHIPSNDQSKVAVVNIKSPRFNKPISTQTATAESMIKKRKTASFAVEQASSFTPGIKSALKVQKTSSSPPTRRSPRKKGILRSNNMPSTAVTKSSSSGTSKSRRRLETVSQLMDGQNGLSQEKDGDHEEALDDMSDFLSTFDVNVDSNSIQI